LVAVFTSLLNKFSQEDRSHELRALILECIELLLNNLLGEDHFGQPNAYNIRKNQLFIKFAWQQFCPSILFQFGDCGLPSKELAPQSINFKQIYTILIQLTGLIGGCKSMISVFEAIYQRILFYTPELDRTLLLKLFKTVFICFFNFFKLKLSLLIKVPTPNLVRKRKVYNVTDHNRRRCIFFIYIYSDFQKRTNTVDV
jgi:hypothetical protein